MKKMMSGLIKNVRFLVAEEKGQGMVEYALIITFIALIVVVGVTGLGNQLLAVFNNMIAGLGGTP